MVRQANQNEDCVNYSGQGLSPETASLIKD